MTRASVPPSTRVGRREQTVGCAEHGGETQIYEIDVGDTEQDVARDHDALREDMVDDVEKGRIDAFENRRGLRLLRPRGHRASMKL
jgi:hypothetical protein